MAELPATGSTAGVRVQICYARPETQILRDVIVAEGTTLHDAIRQSGIFNDAPEIDLTVWRVGIHGKLKSLDTQLRDQDRVEIYRPLLADPMASRRMRAVRSESENPAKR
jgi:uncharacterized protein